MNDITRRRFEELKAGGLLPSPRGAAVAILDALARPDVRIQEVARLVQLDPALSGRLLRYANSALTGQRRPIASLPQAINLLGVFRVRQVTLGLSLIDSYRSGACRAFDYVRYWTTSLATAIAARQLAARGQTPPDESFTCGLLAGVGRLALATAFPADYAAVLDGAADGATLRNAEREHFGIDHAELGAEMLAAWGLPDVFSNAIRHHEQPEETTFVPGSRAHDLCRMLHLAMTVGQLLAEDEAARWRMTPGLFHAAAQAGMEGEEILPVLETVAGLWREWAGEMKLPSGAPADLRQLLSGVPDTHGAAPASNGHCLFLVASDPVRRRDWSERLAAAGSTVLPVASADEAIRLGRLQPGDGVVLDAADSATALPDVVRLGADLPDVPVLLLSGAGGETETERLLAAGATDFLTGDESATTLRARLANLQRLSALTAALRTEREMALRTSGEWARTNRRLLHEALTDVLTQLPNRRYGMDRLGQEFSIAASNGLPLAVLMVDIDHFKQVNDRHGHDAGDAVLQEISGVILESCRRSDTVFRYGGEEFCVICPASGPADAIALAERIAGAVRRTPLQAGGGLSVSVSVGVAWRVGTGSTDDLLADADAALYRAKADGRDRVVAMTESPPAAAGA